MRPQWRGRSALRHGLALPPACGSEQRTLPPPLSLLFLLCRSGKGSFDGGLARRVQGSAVVLLLMLLPIVQGSTSFSARQVISAQAAASCVFAADVDGDGDLDVLWASNGDNTIAWHENMGGTPLSWTEHVISTQATEVSSIFAADLDGDGDLDVLWGGDVVAWYENLGGGAFSARIVISSSVMGATAVFVGDVDGDGKLDVVSASHDDNKIAWYKNVDGVIDEEEVITLDANGASSLFAVDLNGDGTLDVITANADDSEVVWYENRGNGSFEPKHHVIAAVAYVTCVFAVDVDGDGDLDLLSAGSDDSTIAWHENLDGNALSWTDHEIGSLTQAWFVFAADFTGDGYVDVIGSGVSSLAWGENLGSGQFSWTGLFLATKSVFAADVDGDGRLDILSAAHKLTWMRNLGSESDIFNTTEHLISDSKAEEMFVADLDGDGNLDMLIKRENQTVHELAWKKNLGNGAFNSTWHVIMESTYAFFCVLAADVDSDGDLDVVAASGDGRIEITWCENHDGEFNSCHVLSTVKGVRSLLAIDFDGDGDVDLVATNDYGVLWHENIGGGVFDTTQHTISTDTKPYDDVFTADLDADGDLDVLAISKATAIEWFENLGGSVFRAHVISAQAAASCVFAADVDGDGDLDMLWASNGDNTIAWHENMGGTPLSWTEHVISTQPTGPKSIFAADLDGDGDLDVLWGGDVVAWYENLGGGAFSPVQHMISNDGSYVDAVFSADVNGDGQLDVVFRTTDGRVAWFENLLSSAVAQVHVSPLGNDEACAVNPLEPCASLEFALHLGRQLVQLRHVSIEEGTYALHHPLLLGPTRTVLELKGEVVVDCSRIPPSADACVSISQTPFPVALVGGGTLSFINSTTRCVSLDCVATLGTYAPAGSVTCQSLVTGSGATYRVRTTDSCFPQSMAAPFDAAGVVLCPRFAGTVSAFPCSALQAVYTNTTQWAVARPQRVTLFNCTTDGCGGCVDIVNAERVLLRNLTLSDCTAGGDGGALHIADSNVEATLLTVQHSVAAGRGGGVSIVGGSEVTGTYWIVRNNSARTCGGLSFQTVSDRHNLLSDLVVEANSAHETGGGVCVRTCQLDLIRAELHSNIASTYGGGIAIDAAATVTLSSHSVLRDNSAAHGGAIRCEAATVVGDNVLFLHNQATSPSSASGGALSFAYCETVFNSSSFERNEGGTLGGAIHCLGTSSSGRLDLYNCTVERNKASVGAGLASDKCTIAVTHTTFAFNEARGSASTEAEARPGSAGALYIRGEESLDLSNVNFVANVAATGDGGAVWFQQARFSLDNVQFTNNSAVLGGGGAVFWHPVQGTAKLPAEVCEIFNCSHASNSALYGPSIATPAVALLVKTNTMSMRTQATREYFSGGLVLRLVDVFNQTVRSDRSTKITAMSNQTLTGSVQKVVDEGVVNFTNAMWMEAKPGDTHLLWFTTTLDVTVPSPLRVTMRNCLPGTMIEQQLRCRECPPGTSQPLGGQPFCLPCPLHTFTEDEGNALCYNCTEPLYQDVQGSTRCTLCPVGHYARFVKGIWQACEPCPPHTLCDAMTGKVTALRGYWLETEGNGAKTAYRCSSSDACVGGGQCGKNREAIATNVLCGTCKSDHVEWGGHCVKCDGVNWSALVLLFFASLALVSLLHHKTQHTRGGAEVQIFLFFLQTSFMFIQESDAVFWAFLFNTFQFSLNRSTGNDMACLFKASPAGLFVFDLLCPLTAFLSLAVVAAIIVASRKLKLWWKTRRFDAVDRWLFVDKHPHPKEREQGDKRHAPLAYQLLRTCIALYVATLNPVSKAALGFFHCVRVEVGGSVKSVLYMYPAVECGDETYWHLFSLVLFVFLLYCVVVPLGLLVLLVRRKEQLKQDVHHSSVNYALAVLHKSYLPQYFLWGVYSLFRRLVLVFFAVQLSQNQNRQFLAWTLFNITFFVLQVRFRPFRGREFKQSRHTRASVWARTQHTVQQSEFNLLETTSLALLTLLAVLGLSMGDPPTHAEKTGVFYLILIPDLCFFVWAMWRVVPRLCRILSHLLKSALICCRSHRSVQEGQGCSLQHENVPPLTMAENTVELGTRPLERIVSTEV